MLLISVLRVFAERLRLSHIKGRTVHPRFILLLPPVMLFALLVASAVLLEAAQATHFTAPGIIFGLAKRMVFHYTHAAFSNN